MEQLNKDVAELAAFLEQSKSVRVKGVLTAAKAEAEREIVNLEMKARIAAEREAAGSAGDVRRYLHELTDYGWDQSPKFVKLFITLNGVQGCTEEDVIVSYTNTSLQLYVRNLNGKDFGLSVNNLLHGIDVEKSYRKIKTDMVAIYLKKAKEGENWDVLTAIQKRLKQKQETEMSKDSENPGSALVNIMKKMYNDGDSKTKQMIAKAWTERQDKTKMGGGEPDGLDAFGDL